MKNKDVNDDFRGTSVCAEVEVGEFGRVDDPEAVPPLFVFGGKGRSCSFPALRVCSCGLGFHDSELEGGIHFKVNWVLIVRKGFSFLLTEEKTGREASTPRDCAKSDKPILKSLGFRDFSGLLACFFVLIKGK